MPLVTRLYTPTDFSVLAVFTSLVGIFSAVSCLRLEIAIPMPKDDAHAASLVVTAFFVNTITSILIAIVLFIFSTETKALLNREDLAHYIYLLPIGIWITGVYFVLQYWSVRQKIFGLIARTKMSQAITSAGTQIGLGWIGGLGPLGLILGQIFSNGAGVISLSRAAWRRHRALFRAVTRQEMLQEFKTYKNYPKFSTFEAFSNAVALQFPVILIATYAVGPEAGFLMLATRIMSVPMGLISGSISQVYLSQASIEMREGHLFEFTKGIISNLFKAGAAPLIGFALVSPILFSFAFGEAWVRSGEMLIWMVPWFLMQLMASPVSMALHVTGNQRSALVLQVFGLFLRVGVTFAFGIFSPGYIVEGYAITGFVFYSSYLWVIIKLLRKSDHEFKNIEINIK